MELAVVAPVLHSWHTPIKNGSADELARYDAAWGTVGGPTGETAAVKTA